jgi:hypothetical protein
MARQRFIWPDLWDDPDLGRVSPLGMLLYIGCFSLADDDGRIIGDPTFLKAEVFRYRNLTPAQVKKLRDEIASVCNSFTVYTVKGVEYVAFLNWNEWQKPKYPRPSKLPAPPGQRRRKPATESQKSSRNGSPTPSRTVSVTPSGSDSSVGWDGLGSTPQTPQRRRRRAREQPPGEPHPVEARNAWAAFVTGHGWDDTFDEAAIREEIQRVQDSKHTTGDLGIDYALDVWRKNRAKRYPAEAAE